MMISIYHLNSHKSWLWSSTRETLHLLTVYLEYRHMQKANTPKNRLRLRFSSNYQEGRFIPLHTIASHLHSITFHFIASYHISFHYISLHTIAFHLRSNTFHYTPLHSIAYYCILLYFITYHFISFAFHFITSNYFPL